MENENVWLIDHKAALGEGSPLNMDGSTWLTAIGVFQANTEAEALAVFDAYLEANDLEIIERYSISQYNAKDFADDSSCSQQVNEAARKVGEDGQACYVYIRTSEYYADLGDDANESV